MKTKSKGRRRVSVNCAREKRKLKPSSRKVEPWKRLHTLMRPLYKAFPTICMVKGLDSEGSLVVLLIRKAKKP